MGLNVAAGIVVAAAAWAWMFLPGRSGFWTRATLAGALIAAYALARDWRGVRTLFALDGAELAVGIVGGAVLYFVFWIGDRLLRWTMPVLSAEVGDLYRVRAATQPGNMPWVLMVIGPAEEVFWRGFVQHRAGFLVAVAGYALVHLWERKLVLIAAAAVGGLFWGALFAWRGSLVAPIVSHVLWDLAIIVYFPVRKAKAGESR
ncbi:MAG: protease family protein [Acidimicrobiaceae bacterium]|jgi:membrane protease YdiL (CAAX protease family)|nr:protease family protein [Acidimicrobiaceae bacterium]